MAARLMVSVTALSLVACSGPGSGPGLVEGFLPACYGPGPNTNLTPTRIVEVYLNSKLIKSQAFRSDRDHQRYEFELAPGAYEVKGPGIAPIRVQIKSSERVTADLPIPPCV